MAYNEEVVEIRQTEGAAMPEPQTRPRDPAEHLQTEEDMAAYLNIAPEEGDLRLIWVTLGDIARARPMALVAQETGRGEPAQVAVRRGQPRVRHHAEGGAPRSPASGHSDSGLGQTTSSFEGRQQHRSLIYLRST